MRGARISLGNLDGPGVMRIGWTATVSLVLSYIMVASSGEFSSHAPLPLGDLWVFGGFLVGGLLLGYMAQGVAQASAMLAVAVAVPLLVHGGAMVLLRVLLGQGGMLDLLVLWALQRLVGHLVVASVLGLVGAALGIMIQAFSPSR